MKITTATPEFRAWFEQVLEPLIKQTSRIVASGAEMQPFMFLFAQDGKMMVLPVDTEVFDKQQADAMHMRLAQHPLTLGVVLLVESWIKVMDADTTGKIDMTRSIEHDSDKSEALVFNARRGSMQLFAVYPIDRRTNTLAEPMMVDAAAPETYVRANFDPSDHTRH